MNDVIAEKLRQLPDSPGVYRMLSQGRIIYVGKAISLKNRVRSYFQSSRNHSPKVLAMVEKIDDFETILCQSELEALVLENNLIKQHQPYYNILLKDDKTYPYIRIDEKAPFPKLELVRRVEKDGARYFGPYFGANMVREILDAVYQVFPLRTCSRDMLRTYDRPCMRYEIGLCPAPCCGHADPKVYRETLAQVRAFLGGSTGPIVQVLTEKMMRYSEQMRYEQAAMMRDRISRIEQLTERQRAFSISLEDRDIVAMASCGLDRLAQVLYIRSGRLSGSEYFILDNPLEESTADLMRDFLLRHYDDGQMIPPEILLETPCSEMDTLAQLLSQTRGGKVRLHVPQRGEKHDQVLLAAKNAQENIEKHYLRQSRKYERTMGALKQLAGALGIPVPRRIECYDISNFQGDQSVASMVVFIDGEPAKKEYRHFKIKTVEGPNDFASMAEVITRRLSRLKNQDAAFCDMPGMILIDGGKGQLGAAVEAAQAVGLEKLPYFFGLAKQFEWIYRPDENDPIILSHHTSALHLLQRIRDEAHRFAITHHRALRQKKTVHSRLEDIPGVGPARRRALLAHFKSIRAVAQATVNELCAVDSINETVAQAIYDFFQKELDGGNHEH